MTVTGANDCLQRLQACVVGTWILCCSILVGGCDNIMLSPRAQAVRNMESAVCHYRSVKAAAPYVTEASKTLLGLAMAGVEFAQIFQGNAMADTIAKHCHNWSFRFVDEIKVNEGRYIIHTGERNGEMQEYVVLRENGEWKVAMSGK